MFHNLSKLRAIIWQSFTKRKILLFSSAVLLILLPIAYLTLRYGKKTEAAWWNDSWQYRKKVQISNSSDSSLTDFQVAITLDTASLISAGKMQSDCDDIRITDINGKVLNIWVDPGTCNSSTTHLYAKLPTIPTSGTAIFIYYGNPSAVSISNPKKTFDMWEDFEDNDISDWVTSGASIQTVTSPVKNGSYALRVYNGNGGEDAQKSTYLTTSKGIVEWYARVSAVDTARMEINFSDFSINQLVGGLTFEDYGRFGSANGVHWNVDTGVSYSINTWYKFKIEWDDSTHTYNAYIYNSSGALLWSATGQAYTDTTLEVSNDNARFGVHRVDQEVFIDNVLLRKSANVSTSFGSEEKSPGPVAYWKFDEGYGTVAHDSTRNGNHGTITGATWKPESECISGKCVQTDSDGDKVTTASNSFFNLTQKMTYIVWFKYNSSYTTQTYWRWPQLMTNAGGNTHIGYGMRYRLPANQSGNGGDLYFEWGKSPCDGSSYSSITIGSSLLDNKWHMAAVTYDGNTIKTYLDGKLTNQTTYAAGFCNLGATSMLIGYRYSGSPNTAIDEVKIYPYARSAEQIKADYLAGLSAAGTAKGVAAALGAAKERAGGVNLNDGLVAYYKFDESSWTNDCSTATVIDSSGNDNHGKSCPASTGPTGGAAGKFGNGGSFDGSDDYIITDSLISSPSTETLSLWVYPQTSGVIVSELGQQAINSGYHYIKLGLNTTNELKGNIWSCNGNLSFGTISLNQWYHVTLIYDGSSEKAYLNGEFKDSLSCTRSAPSTQYLAFAATDGQTAGGFNDTGYFQGKIDEVRIYNRALSPREVRALYEWAPGPRVYLKLDEGSGTTANDSSGNNRAGTIFNALWSIGKFGKGLKLDGSGDYLQIPDF